MKKRFWGLVAGALLCSALAACGESAPSSAPEQEALGEPLEVFEAALPDDQSLLEGYDYNWYYDGFLFYSYSDDHIVSFLSETGEEFRFYANDALVAADRPLGFSYCPLIYTMDWNKVRVYLHDAPGRDVPVIKSVVELERLAEFEDGMLAPTLEMLTQADPYALVRSNEAAALIAMRARGVERAIRRVSPTGRVYYQVVKDGEPQFWFFYSGAASTSIRYYSYDRENDLPSVQFVVAECSEPTFLPNFKDFLTPDPKGRWSCSWTIDAMTGAVLPPDEVPGPKNK